jgi:isopenicillin N synthase-like dioxygenase
MILANRLAFTIHQVKIPSIDISRYLSQTGNWQQDCKEVAEALKVYGLLVIKDPRVNVEANNQFLDLMEQYFVKRSQQFNEGLRTIDFSP